MKQRIVSLGRALASALVVVVAVSLFSSCASKRFTLVEVEAQEFAKVIQRSGVQLVDVRTPGEVAAGAITGAMNIDVKSTAFDAQAKSKLDGSRPIALYCRSGARGKIAADRLKALGFKGKVYNLKGGYMAWTKK